MTPERLKRIRKELGISQTELALLIGRKGKKKNMHKNVYDWEKGTVEIPGPSAKLLEYIAQGLPMTALALKLPRMVTADEQSDRPLLIRLWRPRFIMDATTLEPIQWIDQPDDDEDKARVLDEAREFLDG